MTKTIISIAAMLAAFTSSAHACDPPHVGDKFQYNDGRVIELAKPVNKGDCFYEKRKACFRPAGTSQPCRWIPFPDDDTRGTSGKWIVMYGVSQD